MSHPLSRETQRRLEEELESTAESHPPMSTSKRAKTSEEDSPLKFSHGVMHNLFMELSKARRGTTPYDDLNIEWEDDALWDVIIPAANLPVELSMHKFKVNLLGYYDAYENNTLSSFNIRNDTWSLIKDVFGKQSGSLGEHLPSYAGRPPPISALEQYRQGVETSGMVQPLQSITSNSRMMQPFQSIPPSSAGCNTNIYTFFAQGLKEIENELSNQAYSWAQLHMTKNKGLVTLFNVYGQEERIQLVKDGYNDWVLNNTLRVPQSPVPSE